MPFRRVLSSIACMLYVSGCTGSFTEDPSASPGGAGGSGSTPSTNGGAPAGGDAPAGGASACENAEIDPGPSPLRLLTRAQYLNTVRELVGEVPGLELALGAENRPSAFGLVQPDVNQSELERLQSAADVIAAFAVADAARLDRLAPCAPGDEPRGCARAFVESFGARAYRAPLGDAADVERHLQLYDAGAATSRARGVELLLRGMLQSPRFLYRVELGTDAAVSAAARPLSGYEMAARLAYTFWDAPPDSALTRLAAEGALDTPEGASVALDAVLADPRGRGAVRRFLEQWTRLADLSGVIKDAALFPEWETSGVRASLQDQARAFFDHVLAAEDGRLDALLGSRTVFVNRDLGAYYGRAGGDAFEAFEADPGAASGLLTLPALLALLSKPDESSPILRGKFVREVLLCQHLPAPPANIPKPPDVEPGVSTRERLAQHEADAACRGCHSLIDSIGFGFENYDAVGRRRETDGGKPVDARGEIVGTRDANGAFSGVAELGRKLAASAEVEECVARQWFRFALSRFEQGGDACAVERIAESFRAAGASLNALPRAVVASDAFRYRRPLVLEDTP